MNILFFLIPKKDVELIYDTYTIRQVIEKMSYHRYSAIPLISKSGQYLNVISTDDILFYVNERKLNIDKTMDTLIKEIVPYRNIKPITIDKSMDDLINLIIDQNFVPVIDDKNNFIGIITRKSIINYLLQNQKTN